MDCLLCHTSIKHPINLKMLLAFRPIELDVLCSECRASFASIAGHVCSGCGRQHEITDLCDECQRWQSIYGVLLKNRALYVYNQAMKNYMQAYKFNGDYRLRQIFAQEFSQRIAAQHADIVVPIPVTAGTMDSRGFNQVQGLITGIELTEVLVASQKFKQVPQSHKTRQERLRLQQPFRLTKAVGQMTGKSVLLVDDVYTTGTTLYHAANLISTLKPTVVKSLTLAR